MKQLFIAAATLVAFAAPSLGACPTGVPDNANDAIRLNQERTACLQRELAAEAERQQLDMRLRQLEADQRRLDLQRRFQALQPVPAPQFPNI